MDQYVSQIENLHQQELLWQAHDCIMSTIPHCRTSMKWQVPFYSYLKDLCYINVYKDHIYVSFMQGQFLGARQNLVKMGTKMVAKYYIKHASDIAEDAFIEILLEATALQESLYSVK